MAINCGRIFPQRSAQKWQSGGKIAARSLWGKPTHLNLDSRLIQNQIRSGLHSTHGIPPVRLEAHQAVPGRQWRLGWCHSLLAEMEAVRSASRPRLADYSDSSLLAGGIPQVQSLERHGK